MPRMKLALFALFALLLTGTSLDSVFLGLHAGRRSTPWQTCTGPPYHCQQDREEHEARRPDCRIYDQPNPTLNSYSLPWITGCPTKRRSNR